MTKNFNNRPLAFSQKVYGRLLRAYPPAHRADYGPAMAQLFRDQCRDAWNESQHWGMTQLWLRTLPDLVSTSMRERLDALKERKSMNEKIASLAHDRTTPTAIFIRVFVVVFLITLIVATAITFILPESYASTARIKVESDAPAADGQSPSYDPYFIQTEFEIIQSELVLNPVINKLKLNVDWGKKYFAGETLPTSRTLEILRQRLLLMPVKNTKLIAITVYGDERTQPAHIANAIAESYRDYRVNSRAQLAAKGLEVLKDNYLAQELQINEAQAALDELQKKFGIPDRIEDLKTQALNLQKSNQEKNVQLGWLHSLDRKKLREVLPPVVQDAALNDLLGRLQDAEQKYHSLTNDYLPSNMVVTRVSSLIAELNQQIDDREQGIMAGLENQAAATKAAADTLSMLLEKAKPSPETKLYWDAKRSLEQRLDFHKLLFSKIEAERLAAQMPLDTLVQITDTAEPGRAPVKPNKTLNIFLGAVAGGFLGLVAGAVCALAAAKFGPRQGKQSLPA